MGSCFESRRRSLLAMRGPLLVLASATACNSLNGSGDLAVDPSSPIEQVPEGGLREAAAPDASEAAAGPAAYAALGWTYRRTVALSSDVTTALVNRAVLVVFPAAFDYSHTSASAADLRFTTDLARAAELPYFVEDWTPGAASHVWVSVPDVPTGSSLLHVFYGKSAAPAASSFEATFPKARRTTGGGAGSFVATGDIDVDWFELRAGDTLTLAAGAPLRITASRIVIAGSILGSGRGNPGGASPSGAGSGPGGGMVVAGSGAGGGGYGGIGGQGGSDMAGTGGAGGAVYGTASGTDVAMGSGGGTMDSRPGGVGGGALTLAGWHVSVKSAITMDGTAGMGLSGQNSGGGSGGGILVGGWSVDLAGAALSARGGAGGPCAASANDAGGGGAGGRIKILRRASGALVAASSMNVGGGAGGTGGGTTAPGSPGANGTTNVNDASSFVQGVESALGPELAAAAP